MLIFSAIIIFLTFLQDAAKAITPLFFVFLFSYVFYSIVQYRRIMNVGTGRQYQNSFSSAIIERLETVRRTKCYDFTVDRKTGERHYFISKEVQTGCMFCPKKAWEDLKADIESASGEELQRLV